MSMEQPETAPDLVGRTSARLLAAGVDRRARLEALHLLAILDASVDITGRVRRPLDDLAGEFELDPMVVMRALDHLEQAGAVQRSGAHVVLLGNNPEGLGGMQLADFLDDVRTSFGGSGSSARRSPWFARSGAMLVAAAAAVAVVTLAPSRTAFEQPLALLDASSTTIEERVDDPADVLDTPIDTIQPTTTIVAPAVGPADTAVVAAEAPCPTGSPIAELLDGILEISNPTDEDLVVTSMIVGGRALSQPITVVAGQTVTRVVPSAIGAVDAHIESWEWSSDPVARACPS